MSGQEVPLTLLPGKSHLLTHSSRMITSTAADFLALSSEPVSFMPHIASAALLRHRLRKAVKKPQHPTHCPHLAQGYTFLHISVLTGKPIPTGEVTRPLINHFWAKQMENVHWCGHVNRHIPISICVYTKEKCAHFLYCITPPWMPKNSLFWNQVYLRACTHGDCLEGALLYCPLSFLQLYGDEIFNIFCEAVFLAKLYISVFILSL